MENESLQTRKIRLTTLEHSAKKHSESLPSRIVTREMDVAIKRLIPGQISRSALLELFDQRATFASIKAWRYGWRGAPQWAIDLIRGKLAARAASDLAAGAKLRPGMGQSTNGNTIGTKALAAWRERKARERDEQQKRES